MLLPSAAWVRWCSEATCSHGGWPRWRGGWCNISARFYVDTRRKIDACNLYNGLADLLQHVGVVEDDCVFLSWDGSRLAHDPDLPRVDVEITKRLAPW